MQDFRLYVILDEGICRKSGDILEIARQVILAGADVIQLRAKGCVEEKILNIGRAIKELTQRSKTLFLLNDYPRLAQTIDAHGVHLGRQDLPVKEARNILGENKIIGLSAHSLKEAHRAEKQGADYIGIGPVFATPLKAHLAPLTTEMIAQVKDKIKIPFVAIGGITLDNLKLVLSYGVKRVAVCRAIIAAKDITAATKEFRQRLYQ